MRARRSTAVALFLVACGGTTVIDGGSGGGQGDGGSAQAQASSSSTGNPSCVSCDKVFAFSDWPTYTVCPGDETADYQRLLACGCPSCSEPCSNEFGELFCQGGFVDSPCATCLYDLCESEYGACMSEP